ncbi:stage V sporulation protein B [Lachnospiraceae bacterium MD308]|jgi:Membrane protein involved in the export of O-antigen and teichoic acid|nr:stage V sporulation protein B [Lachnospiraceae bacterium MD308]MCI8503407.1 polysaccharide biosynthesis protein [Dorea sp.]
MSVKRTILKGTFILTITGFATRFMGFFYRIFLSHTFGEEGVGLYQLIFPVYALCFSLTSAGIETALARCVAKRASVGKKKEARKLLFTAMALSVSLSVIVMLLLQSYAGLIAEQFLQETRCSDLLIILSYAFPFASVHSCIVGYYLGLKETGIPAFSQLIEQLVRILSVYLFYLIGTRSGAEFGISIAVGGLIAGEIASSMFCLKIITKKTPVCQRLAKRIAELPKYLTFAGELFLLSAPLTASRVLLNLLQSIEAVSIPLKLQSHGMTVSQSLSIYGVLTGMALPCVLFPSAITNSVSTMLLPTVAEAQTLKREQQMKNIIQKSVCCCVLLGSLCCILLLLSGQWIGFHIFNSRYAGDYIVTLAWMCPFLYANTTLISIINGIGKTTLSFLINTFSLILRILSVFYCIPVFGIEGYLLGLLASQLAAFLLCILYLSHYLRSPKSA